MTFDIDMGTAEDLVAANRKDVPVMWGFPGAQFNVQVQASNLEFMVRKVIGGRPISKKRARKLQRQGESVDRFGRQWFWLGRGKSFYLIHDEGVQDVTKTDN